jgi:tetratricopeptide (TPR) repeat protein
LLVLLSLPASFLAQQQSLERGFERAVRLFEIGSLAEAESEFRRVLVALPQAPEPYFYLGRICLQTHRAEEAEGLLRRTVSLNPEFVDAWKVLGQLYAEQGKYGEAKASLLQVLKREPSNANAHFNLGTTLERLSDDVGAIQEFEAAMKLAAADSFVYAKARTNSGLLHLKLGKIHHQSERTNEAVRDLEIARERLEPSYELYALLGDVYSKTKDPRALEYLLKAAELNNSREISNAQLLRALDRENGVVGSLDQLKQKAASEPENTLYQILLASAYWDREEYLSALQHYQQVVRLNPSSARAHYLVGFIHQLLGNVPAAKQSLQTALKLDPEFVPTLLILGELLAGEGHWPQALPLLQKAANGSSNDLSVRLKLGQLFLDHGNIELARVQLTLAEKMDPQNKKVHYLLGRLYTVLGQQQLAERHFTNFSRVEREELENKRRK